MLSPRPQPMPYDEQLEHERSSTPTRPRPKMASAANISPFHSRISPPPIRAHSRIGHATPVTVKTGISVTPVVTSNAIAPDFSSAESQNKGQAASHGAMEQRALIIYRYEVWCLQSLPVTIIILVLLMIGQGTTFRIYPIYRSQCKRRKLPPY